MSPRPPPLVLSRAVRVAGPLVALLVALLVFSTVNRGSSASTPDRARSGRVPFVSPQADTDARIAGLQRQIRAGRGRAAYAELGSAYLQKVRENGDATFYPRAQEAFRLAARREPGNLAAVVGQGTLALARHDFREALRLGRRARRLAPEAAGVLVDALVEQQKIGRYATEDSPAWAKAGGLKTGRCRTGSRNSLAAGSAVVPSIHLGQRGSMQSKPVGEPHASTGAEG